MFTSAELKAEALYALGRYRTVAYEYSYTEKAEYVRRHCDNYVDYTPAFLTTY